MAAVVCGRLLSAAVELGRMACPCFIPDAVRLPVHHIHQKFSGDADFLWEDAIFSNMRQLGHGWSVMGRQWSIARPIPCGGLAHITNPSPKCRATELNQPDRAWLAIIIMI